MPSNSEEEIELKENTSTVRAFWLPYFSSISQSIGILDGVPKKSVMNMMKVIWDQVGTPQNPLDWSEPDLWIPDRLKGEDEKLAFRIWNESNRKINPRYFENIYRFINSYELLALDITDTYRLLDKGKSFLNNDEHLIREIDQCEGLTKVLSVLAAKDQAKLSDLLPEWEEFLLKHSKITTETTFPGYIEN